MLNKGELLFCSDVDLQPGLYVYSLITIELTSDFRIRSCLLIDIRN